MKDAKKNCTTCLNFTNDRTQHKIATKHSCGEGYFENYTPHDTIDWLGLISMAQTCQQHSDDNSSEK